MKQALIIMYLGCLAISAVFAQDKNVQNLYDAIKALDSKNIEKYAKKIGNIRDVSLNNETPLEFLFYQYREFFPDHGIPIIELLVKYGADPNKGSERFNNTYYCIEDACHSNNPKAVEKLIELGADVKKGYPLHRAALHRRLEVVKLLVEKYGLDVNQKNKNGQTSLICATLYYDSYETSLPLVQYLIEKGADKNATDKEGKTALDYAIKNNNQPVIRYLQNIGGTHTITIIEKKEKRCSRCNGSGTEEPIDVYRTCSWCGGKGYREKSGQVVGADATYEFYQKNQCLNCKGKGKIFSHKEYPKCTQCGGRGFIKE